MRLLVPRRDGQISRREAGDDEVVVTLSRPNPALLESLSLFAASIVPRETYRRLGARRFAVAPVGSGAFVVDSLAEGRELRLRRNPGYWRTGQPYLDGVTMRFLPDDNARILDVTSGQADVAEAIPYSQIAALSAKPNIEVETSVTTGIDHVYLNTTRAPLDDVRVRQALAYATPVEQIVRTVYFGNATAADDVLPNGRYEDPDAAPLRYDLDRARALLKQAGHAGGFPLTLSIVGSDSVSKQLASILQESWRPLGVQLRIVQKDAPTIATDRPKGDYEALFFTRTPRTSLSRTSSTGRSTRRAAARTASSPGTDRIPPTG